MMASADEAAAAQKGVQLKPARRMGLFTEVRVNDVVEDTKEKKQHAESEKDDSEDWASGRNRWIVCPAEPEERQRWKN